PKVVTIRKHETLMAIPLTSGGDVNPITPKYSRARFIILTATYFWKTGRQLTLSV
ncbi:MAG: hypothetical protein ACI9HK_004562, partial [Pirellulaceae bacterium]